MDVDKRCDEARVTREHGTAPAARLVEAVRRAGYEAKVSPTHRLPFDVPGMACGGCPERVRTALLGRRGVRAVHFPTRTRVIVFYDPRRLSPDQLAEAIRAAGFRPRTG